MIIDIRFKAFCISNMLSFTSFKFFVCNFIHIRLFNICRTLLIFKKGTLNFYLNLCRLEYTYVIDELSVRTRREYRLSPTAGFLQWRRSACEETVFDIVWGFCGAMWGKCGDS